MASLTGSTTATQGRSFANSNKIIHAELIGSDFASACGIEVTDSAPVLALCKELLAHGVDPHCRLHAYRGGTLCLSIRSIGEAAQLRVRGGGIGFAKLGRPTAPAIAPNGRDDAAQPPSIGVAP